VTFNLRGPFKGGCEKRKGNCVKGREEREGGRGGRRSEGKKIAGN
jgi:hypothetical protein